MGYAEIHAARTGGGAGAAPRKMKYRGDSSREVRTAIPPKLGDLHRICKDVFGLKGDIGLHRDGKEHIADENRYSTIRDGDRLVVVDGSGQAHDLPDLIRRYSQDHVISFTGTSEARDAFTPKQIEPPPPAQHDPRDPWWNKLKFEGTSEAKSQFTPKKAEQPEPPVRTGGGGAPRQSPKFEGTSEARSAFTPKQIEPPPPPQQDPRDPWWNKLKFEGTSEAKSQFTPKKSEQPEIPVPRVPVPSQPRTKFEGTSEARSAFTPKQIEPAPPPQQGGRDPWWGKLKFEGTSEAKAQFTPKRGEFVTPKVGQSHGPRTGPTVCLQPSLGMVRASDASSSAASNA